MKLNCKNCGAIISSKEHKCPYCGGFNYIGARKKYFRDLKQIKDDLEDLDDIPLESYKREASGQAKRIIKTMIICTIIVALIYGIVTLVSYLKEKSYDHNTIDPKEQLLWDLENFPKLNEWYDAGEYDKIEEFRIDLIYQNPYYTLYNWEHIEFFDVYQNCLHAMESKEAIENKVNSSVYHINSALYGALEICYNLKNRGLDDDEIERLEVYRSDMEMLLYDTLGLTEKEVLSLYEQVSADGYINYTKIEEFSADYIKRLD